MHDAVEPTAEEFFASSTGACVYVNVRGRAFRVQFEAPDSSGVARGTTSAGADEAVAAATGAREKYKAQLGPLFERVAVEMASRTRP